MGWSDGGGGKGGKGKDGGRGSRSDSGTAPPSQPSKLSGRTCCEKSGCPGWVWSSRLTKNNWCDECGRAYPIIKKTPPGRASSQGSAPYSRDDEKWGKRWWEKEDESPRSHSVPSYKGHKSDKKDKRKDKDDKEKEKDKAYRKKGGRKR